MRYSDEQRQAALDCLVVNEGDFRRTSAETGIAARTLRKWAQQAQDGDAELAQLRERLAAFQEYIRISESDDPREKLRDTVLVTLVDNAIPLSKSMGVDIETATLAQKASALKQILSIILKLLELLPFREQVIRIEFVDPDGTTHQTPYWARKHSGEPDAV
jgi:transposase-like protein